MNISVRKKQSTVKQMAYARRVLTGDGDSRATIALDVGYSPNVSKSVTTHIENTPGFNNAMAALALESNNLALAALHEFKARGLKDFSNKDLVGAMNAITAAWSKFNAIPKEKRTDENKNKLRTVILQQIENQTNISSPAEPKPPVIETPEINGMSTDSANDF